MDRIQTYPFYSLLFFGCAPDHMSIDQPSPYPATPQQLGIDFTELRSHLEAGDYRKADDETRALLIKMAGEGAVKRGWVYFSEIKSIPNVDLQTMDNL